MPLVFKYKPNDLPTNEEDDIIGNEIKNKIQNNMCKCDLCKFNEESMILYHLNLPNQIITNIL